MGEIRVEPSEDCSEERTEPFAPSEIDARLRSMQAEALLQRRQYDASVPLDKLQVEDHHHKQGIRILVRPLTRSRSVSPGSENCQWLALRAEVASEEQPQHQVLAVTQTAKDINFSMRVPADSDDDRALWCELYYDPASDNQILLNRSDIPITLSSATADADTSLPSASNINPGNTKSLSPGTWRISVRGAAVLDFRVLERRPAMLQPEQSFTTEEVSSVASTDMTSSSIKRSFEEDDDGVPRGDKKPRTLSDAAADAPKDGVIMFLPAAADVDPLVLPLPHADKGQDVALIDGHPLLDIQKDDTVAVPGISLGGCELDKYQLTKREQIASTSLSSVFTAEHSKVPNGIVTVKVLKTRMANPNAKAHDQERNVIRQADMWLREYRSHDNLRHNSIVRLYGGDARYLSLYMEHIDAPDLSSKMRWRDPATEMFKGSRADAIRILRDTASALHYIHGRRLVHNDIKPANILYSPERGAVLCDFGLSTDLSNPLTAGGTPYYVPPEFIGRKLRGPPSDVWALGITLLYVLRKIPFPDARARQQHPKPLYWMIADLNKPRDASVHRPSPTGRPVLPAVEQMRLWLAEINEAREKLDLRDGLLRIVSEMLRPNPTQRVNMAHLIQDLYADQGTTIR